MNELDVVFTPRSERDLLTIPARFANQILSDLGLLRTPPWPPGKVKKLRGRDYWEMKTGDYRTIFWPRRSQVIVVRVVNRRDLELTLGRIDVRALVEWIRSESRTRDSGNE